MKTPLPHRRFHTDSQIENEKDYEAQLQKRKLRTLKKRGLTKWFDSGVDVQGAGEYLVAMHLFCLDKMNRAEEMPGNQIPPSTLQPNPA